MPGVTPYTLDILCSPLETAAFDVEVLDHTFGRDDWRFVEYFATREPRLVGVTLRSMGSVQPQKQRIFLPEHLAVIGAMRAHTTAPVVLGRTGFSSIPCAAIEYIRVPHGVKGPGEVILCDLKSLADCASIIEYERQFSFDEDGRTRPVLYIYPDLLEDRDTAGRPDGRWVKTIRGIQGYVPESEHYRIALPTLAGDGHNPFPRHAAALGYKGTYYLWWRDQERILGEANLAGLTACSA